MTGSTGLSQARIAQIAVNVRDLPRAVAFYREALGLTLLFEVPGMAFFACGGVRLMLSVPEKPEHTHPSSILYFQVPDIQAAHAELSGRSVSFIDKPHLLAKMPDHDLWMVFFRDGEGSTLALMSEVRQERPAV
jgi:methylmalonyl-CoA/ethylmalonyl-CoA epimerase